MAEMLVDSTKLDACLDAEADAIRAKTGDSNDITFDFANNKGFADAIAAIPSGGGAEIVHQQFTHTEDWDTDATGNAAAFYNTYVANFSAGKSNGVIYANISNNASTSAWKALYMFRNKNLTNQTAWKRRNGFANNATDTGLTSISFYLSAGSIIDLFFFPFGGGA